MLLISNLKTTYALQLTSGTQVVAVRASQIHQPNTPTTEIVQNPDIRALQALLEAEYIPYPVMKSAKLSQ